MNRTFENFPWGISSSFGGIVNKSYRNWKTDTSGLDFFIYSCGLPNLSFSYDGISSWSGNSIQSSRIAGAGASTNIKIAKLKAIAESAERYAASVLLEGEYVFASALELEKEIIDLKPVIDCVNAEIDNTNGRMSRFDPDFPIRWVPGWCLIENRQKYVPAVMTHLFPRPQHGEMFWLPITTGVAAHTSFKHAAISAICEVIERDALGLNWLTNRVLPRIECEDGFDQSEETQEQIRESIRSDTNFHFFNATTDIKVPTVYTIESNNRSSKLANVVSCCTDFSWKNAVGSTIRELASTKTALGAYEETVPESAEQCNELEHGAVFMAQNSKSKHFSSLLSSKNIFQMSQYDSLSEYSKEAQIRYLISQIKPHTSDLIIVDMTTDDLREFGLFVVRAVIPGLMPMSTDYNYRYIGHPRLMKFARDYVDKDFDLSMINKMPQAFA